MVRQDGELLHGGQPVLMAGAPLDEAKGAIADAEQQRSEKRKGDVIPFAEAHRDSLREAGIVVQLVAPRPKRGGRR